MTRLTPAGPVDAGEVATLIGRRLDMLADLIGLRDVSWSESSADLDLTLTGRDGQHRRFRLTVQQTGGQTR